MTPLQLFLLGYQFSGSSTTLPHSSVHKPFVYCFTDTSIPRFDEKIVGGENEFVDLFHVAETFREQYPEDFDILCKVPAAFETIHYKR